MDLGSPPTSSMCCNRIPNCPSSTLTSSRPSGGPVGSRKWPMTPRGSRRSVATPAKRPRVVHHRDRVQPPVKGRVGDARKGTGLLRDPARHDCAGGAHGQRVADRVDVGGHSVPEEKVTARYERLWPLVVAAAGAVDEAWFYDNSSASAPYRVLGSTRAGQVSPVGAIPEWVPEPVRQFMCEPSR